MIKELNSLRGVLALIIFIHHLNLYYGGGALAVSFFFVLGGFCATLGYINKVQAPDFSYKNYILGKVIKFYPIHWLILLIVAPITLYYSFSVLKLLTLGLNAALIHSWIPLQYVYFSYNAVSWYLADTLVFVAIFPFILKWILEASKKKKQIIAAVVAIIYVMVWIILPKQYSHSVFYIHPAIRIIDYVAGMVAALFFLRIKELNSIKQNVQAHIIAIQIFEIVLFIALIVISLSNKQLIDHAVIFIPLECILLILISLNGGGILRSSILQKLGSISYAFFLSHKIIINYLDQLLNHYDLNHLYIKAPAAFLLSISISYILIFYYEKNITIWLKKKISPQYMTAQ